MRIAFWIATLLLLICVWCLWASLENKPKATGCNLIEFGVLHHGPGIDDMNDGLILFVNYSGGYSVMIDAKFHESTPDAYKYFKQFQKGYMFEFETLDFSMIRVDGFLLRVKKIESFKK